MDADLVALGELERKELELLRELSTTFKPDGNISNVNDAKRLAKDLEDEEDDDDSDDGQVLTPKYSIDYSR